MKNYNNKYIFSFGFLVLTLACSTKKDNFATRNFQALNTKYNVLFNGGVAFDKGLETVKSQYIDNFWEILPVERQQPVLSKKDNEPTKNADFEKAELKATKAIQRRSMNIDGTERNTQIDEAYLMLGKSRYNDQRFIPALEAFNYILYKYPKSDKIYDARIWIEKTNMRLDNDNLALINLTELLKEIKLKNQTYADANAILAQAYIKTEQKDSAIFSLSRAIQYTKIDEEKARFRFIKAQLYEQLNQKESAFSTYQDIIDMKRNSPRIYTINAQNRQAMQFDFATGDSITFIEKYNKLLLDRENRPFLDILNHQLGVTYDNAKNAKQAQKYYNKSLRAKSQDLYLEATNYRKIADINFYSSKYVAARKYYDSTMTKLTPRTKEHNFIKKKRENLEDVIKYEAIANTNDSILNILALSDSDKNKFYEDYIIKVKADEAKQKLIDEKIKLAANKNNVTKDDSSKKLPVNNEFGANVNSNSNFYFYNQVTVAYGKVEFRKNWGDRTLKNNWRNGASAASVSEEIIEESNEQTADLNTKEKDNSQKSVSNSKYESGFYLDKLPKKQSEIDVLIKDRNDAYFELGSIYKEKFKEYKLAQNKLEKLLDKKPSEKMVLPTMYNLLKIYEITDLEKAIAMKASILKMYPDSRYALILINESQNKSITDSPQLVYNELFQRYLSGDYRNLSNDLNKYIEQYNGEEILPRFELLKANNIGKLKGLSEYKNALTYVAASYPKVQEGKKAQEFLENDIVAMEELQFNLEKPLSWKILFRIDCNNDKMARPLLDKINKFVNSKTYNKAKTSIDYYLLDEDFIVVHGLKSEIQANDVMSILRDYNDYKIENQGIIISSDNYKIVQIKKNIEDYLCDPKKVPNPVVVKKAIQENQVPEYQKVIPDTQKSKNQKPIGPPGSMRQSEQMDTDDDGNQENKQQDLRQKKK